MKYIIIGNIKGTENEPHFKITTQLSCGQIEETVYFDVYVDTAEEAMNEIVKYLEPWTIKERN